MSARIFGFPKTSTCIFHWFQRMVQNGPAYYWDYWELERCLLLFRIKKQKGYKMKEMADVPWNNIINQTIRNWIPREYRYYTCSKGSVLRCSTSILNRLIVETKCFTERFSNSTVKNMTEGSEWYMYSLFEGAEHFSISVTQIYNLNEEIRESFGLGGWT